MEIGALSVFFLFPLAEFAQKKLLPFAKGQACSTLFGTMEFHLLPPPSDRTISFVPFGKSAFALYDRQGRK